MDKGRLHFVDIAKEVLAMNEDGSDCKTVAVVPAQPSGLGWSVRTSLANRTMHNGIGSWRICSACPSSWRAPDPRMLLREYFRFDSGVALDLELYPNWTRTYGQYTQHTASQHRHACVKASAVVLHTTI